MANKNSVMMKDIPKKERPRERLLKYGAENLSNQELLEIILRTGIKNKPVSFLAQKILATFKGLSEIKNATVQEISKIEGIGKVKAIQILAAIELGKRVVNEKNVIIERFDNSQKIFDFFHYDLRFLKQEHFYTLYLDTKKQLIAKKLNFIGSLNASLIHPREIFKYAYQFSASAIICVHNHPSGDVTPSINDIEVTNKLKEIGKILNIPLVDHIIIGHNNYYSFFDEGKI